MATFCTQCVLMTHHCKSMQPFNTCTLHSTEMRCIVLTRSVRDTSAAGFDTASHSSGKSPYSLGICNSLLKFDTLNHSQFLALELLIFGACTTLLPHSAGITLEISWLKNINTASMTLACDCPLSYYCVHGFSRMPSGI